ncbi:unnamed protein product [Brachionus calyciflorus]|uniref:Uncharacterized protein n=1 Tax=Brachionus calyciflorus TaxID=104777 RepID=A0A814FBT1_9BILA|nr:unnamed protein product [Brachionus calyciflorus]
MFDTLVHKVVPGAIIHFPSNEHNPSFVRLDVHLEDQQNVVFDAENEVNLEQHQRTTLTAWFEFNCEQESNLGLIYKDIPSLCTWDRNLKKLKIREKKKKDVIGRVYLVSRSDKERYNILYEYRQKKDPQIDFNDEITNVGLHKLYQTLIDFNAPNQISNQLPNVNIEFLNISYVSPLFDQADTDDYFLNKVVEENI